MAAFDRRRASAIGRLRDFANGCFEVLQFENAWFG